MKVPGVKEKKKKRMTCESQYVSKNFLLICKRIKMVSLFGATTHHVAQPLIAITVAK